MKMIWNVLSVLLLVHVLALGGLVAWLYSSGRLNGDRVDALVAMFERTIEQEAADLALEEEKIAEATEAALAVERRERIARGTQTMQDRLDDEQEADDANVLRAQRMQKEIESLRRLLANSESIITTKTEKLAAEQKAFDDRMKRIGEKLVDEDFKKAVGWFEQLKPKLAKEMFQAMIEQNRMDEVVDYLAAMDEGKSATIIGEFKQGAEVDQAVVIVNALRQRGPDYMAKAQANQSPPGIN